MFSTKVVVTMSSRSAQSLTSSKTHGSSKSSLYGSVVSTACNGYCTGRVNAVAQRSQIP